MGIKREKRMEGDRRGWEETKEDEMGEKWMEGKKRGWKDNVEGGRGEKRMKGNGRRREGGKLRCNRMRMRGHVKKYFFFDN